MTAIEQENEMRGYYIARKGVRCPFRGCHSDDKD